MFNPYEEESFSLLYFFSFVQPPDPWTEEVQTPWQVTQALIIKKKKSPSILPHFLLKSKKFNIVKELKNLSKQPIQKGTCNSQLQQTCACSLK